MLFPVTIALKRWLNGGQEDACTFSEETSVEGMKEQAGESPAEGKNLGACCERGRKNVLLDFQALLERKVFAVDLDVEFSVILFSETNLLSCCIGNKVKKTHEVHGHNGQEEDLLAATLDSSFLCCILFVNKNNYVF